MISKISVLVTTCLLASACSSLKQGVVGTTRANVTPFATEAINTLSVESMEIRRNRLTRLRDYFDAETVQINELTAVIEKIEEFRRSIALYSLELVHITSMDMEQAEKSQQLAAYLRSEFAEVIIINLGVGQADFSSIVNNVGQQEEFLDAIKAVNPLITVASDYHEALLRQLETEKLPSVLRLFDTAIEEDFTAVLDQEHLLETRRDQLMMALQYLDAAMAGDSAVLPQLRNLPAFRLDASRPSLQPSQAELLAAEEYIIAELRKNAEILELIKPSLGAYAEARTELDELTRKISGGVKVARFQLAAWRKAHEDLGNGVRDPGKWLSAAYSAARVI